MDIVSVLQKTIDNKILFCGVINICAEDIRFNNFDFI